jgi:hypothetical protein
MLIFANFFFFFFFFHCAANVLLSIFRRLAFSLTSVDDAADALAEIYYDSPGVFTRAEVANDAAARSAVNPMPR